MKKKGTKASRFFSGEGREYVVTQRARISMRDAGLGFLAGVIMMNILWAAMARHNIQQRLPMSNKPIYRTISTTEAMKRVDPKPVAYPTYKLSNGRAEYMKARIGEEPRFAKRG